MNEKDIYFVDGLAVDRSTMEFHCGYCSPLRTFYRIIAFIIPDLKRASSTIYLFVYFSRTKLKGR